MEAVRVLPRLRIDTAQVLQRAEAQRDLVTYPSAIRGVGYITDGTEVMAITSSGGYLRISAEKLIDLIEELQYINEDTERRKRD